MTEDRKWSHSMVTFHEGASYTVANVRFVRNVPKRVTSRVVRNSLNGISGFLIQDFFKEESTGNSEAEAPKKKLKKKAVKKVKTVQDGE